MIWCTCRITMRQATRLTLLLLTLTKLSSSPVGIILNKTLKLEVPRIKTLSFSLFPIFFGLIVWAMSRINHISPLNDSFYSLHFPNKTEWHCKFSGCTWGASISFGIMEILDDSLAVLVPLPCHLSHLILCANLNSKAKDTAVTNDKVINP